VIFGISDNVCGLDCFAEIFERVLVCDDSHELYPCDKFDILSSDGFEVAPKFSDSIHCVLIVLQFQVPDLVSH